MDEHRRIMVRLVGVLLAFFLCVAAGPLPARGQFVVASMDVLRPIFSRLLGDPPYMRLDGTPDLYEGGYARISVYARNADINGMRIDELWIKLVGASFDPGSLRQGTLKVLGLRDNGIYGKLRLASVQDFLNHQGAVQDVRLAVDDEAVIGNATVLYNGIPTRVRMQGVFQVYGEPEVFFHIQALLVNSLPVPYVLVDRLERQMNPVVDFRTWPVPFRIRSFHQSPEGFVLSSQSDFSQPCNICGGPQLQLKP